MVIYVARLTNAMVRWLHSIALCDVHHGCINLVYNVCIINFSLDLLEFFGRVLYRVRPDYEYLQYGAVDVPLPLLTLFAEI